MRATRLRGGWQLTPPADTLRRLATDGQQQRGGGISQDYYVQVRYPRGRRWVTVAVSDRRGKASSIAAGAHRDFHDLRDEAPQQVRIVSAAQLVREGGEREIGRAGADLSHRPKRP